MKAHYVPPQQVDWSRSLPRDRALDPSIVDLVPHRAKVLDLGCGNGDLLLRLKAERGVDERGVELEPSAVAECLSRGLSVIQADLEESLLDLREESYDVVVLNQVLLATARPLQLLTEALRVGRRVLVSFPNFAYWRIRSQILFRGRMPVTLTLPYLWYETPNIRSASVKDFRALCETKQWDVYTELFVNLDRLERARPITIWPNLRASLALFALERKAR
ncbi:MAG: methionine biosynthesis protein MetW [Desulfovibrionales bacterium]|nr:MAG: methionine biosynthesis protein MetW [Desulfovibrionales bacterium]